MAKRKIIFQHLRKTGGTTIRDLLLPFFPEHQAVDPTTIFADEIDIDDALRSSHENMFSYGHPEIISSAPADAFKFGFFREPYARLLSDRRQWMQASPEDIAAMPPDRAEAIRNLQNRPFHDILGQMHDYPVTISSFWNYQCVTLGAWPIIRAQSPRRASINYRNANLYRHFASTAELLSWLESNAGTILRRARVSLEALDYVGLTETLDYSVRELFAHIGLPEPGAIPVLNARAPFADEVDPALRDFATRFLELDFELYECAKERSAQMRRIARGSPIDYTGRVLDLRAPSSYAADEPPGGHGWHLAHRRSDGHWSRWTTGAGRSHFALRSGPATFEVIISFWGAVSESAITTMRLEIDGSPLPCVFEPSPNGLTLKSMFVRDELASFDLVLIVTGTKGDHGVEVRQISFTPLVSDHGANRLSMPNAGCSLMSAKALIVSTTLAVFLLDLETGLATMVETGRGVYYGISFSTDRVYVACRRASLTSPKDQQQNAILEFDRNFRLVETLIPPKPIRDVHQIFHLGDTLFIASTYDDEVVIFDTSRRAWQHWRPFGDAPGANTHHINSIWGRDGRLFLTGTRPQAWIAEFDSEKRLVRRSHLGVGLHNVWAQDNNLWSCSSGEGALISTAGDRLVVLASGFVRGIAQIGEQKYVGVSQRLDRGDRTESDCSVVLLGMNPIIARNYSFNGLGMIHDMRALAVADGTTHNGVVFEIDAAPLEGRFLTYRTSSELIPAP